MSRDIRRVVYRVSALEGGLAFRLIEEALRLFSGCGFFHSHLRLDFPRALKRTKQASLTGLFLKAPRG